MHDIEPEQRHSRNRCMDTLRHAKSSPRRGIVGGAANLAQRLQGYGVVNRRVRARRRDLRRAPITEKPYAPTSFTPASTQPRLNLVLGSV